MSFLKNNKYSIFVIYFNILFIVTLTKVSYKITNFNYLFVSLLYFIGILLYWLYTILFKRRSLKIVFTIFLFGGVFLFLYLNQNYVANMFREKIIDNFNLIDSLVAKSLPTDFNNFKPIFIFVLPILTYIIIFLSDKGLLNSILILNLVLISILWYLGYTEEVKKYLYLYVLINLVTYSINSFISNIKKLRKKGIKLGISSYKVFIYTAILSVIVAGVTSILPQEYSGKYSTDIQSKFYNKFIKNTEQGIAKGKKYEYDLSFSGYDNKNKKLGGPVSPNKLIALRVESDNTYYLKGSVKDIYDGFSWSQSERKYNVKKDTDSSLLKGNAYLSYIDASQEISIYPEELNSSTIFMPELAYNAFTEKGNIYYDDIPTFMSSEILSNSYKVYFYNLNDKGEYILNNQNKRVQEVGTIFYVENYKKYLQLPTNISMRVYDLVYNLTKDKKDNFQKVQAIRDYLNKTYPYTLNVSVVPEGQEFLDYFLFNEKKGYCTYFATAQTIMCRIAGIPARYVEGFNMVNEKDENGQYVVRNENAHAWTEVLYMENEAQGLWYTVDAVPNAVEAIHMEEEENKNSIDPNIQGNNSENMNIPKRPNQAETEGFQEDTVKSSKYFMLLKIIYILGAIILLNALVILAFIFKIKLILSRKSIIPIYKFSIERLETIGYKNSDFTPDLHLINKMGEELSYKVKKAAVLAYKEYYGSKVPEDFNKKEYYKFIEAYIRKRQSSIGYFIRKYYFIKNISFLKRKIMLLYRKIKEN